MRFPDTAYDAPATDACSSLSRIDRALKWLISPPNCRNLSLRGYAVIRYLAVY